ncbi:MAG: dienelactone hydrolase family protein [Bacteroidaceae bacterium]|nr:dienelactone hydrolase family protein [Bacteroidaceae bacterium]
MLLTNNLKVAGQQLHSYKNLAPGGYHFWFYSPEAPPPTIVPMLPEDKELRRRMEIEQHFHVRSYDWVNWQEKEENMRKQQQKPLVIFLHGASLCGRDIKQVLRYGTLDAMDRGLELNAFVLAPQNPGGAWNPEKLMSLIEWASRTHNSIDTTRIYVLGMSLGGYGALDLPAAYPHRIAASMSICGGAITKEIDNLNKVPIWILHGTADVAVPINCSDRVVAAMKRKNTPQRLIYSRLKGYDHSYPARLFYMQETYDWLFSHRLTDPNRPVNQDIYIGPRNIPMAYRRMGRNGHMSFNGQKEVYGHSNLEAQEFAIIQDSIARADSIEALKESRKYANRIGLSNNKH